MESKYRKLFILFLLFVIYSMLCIYKSASSFFLIIIFECFIFPIYFLFINKHNLKNNRYIFFYICTYIIFILILQNIRSNINRFWIFLDKLEINWYKFFINYPTFKWFFSIVLFCLFNFIWDVISTKFNKRHL